MNNCKNNNKYIIIKYQKIVNITRIQITSRLKHSINLKFIRKERVFNETFYFQRRNKLKLHTISNITKFYMVVIYLLLFKRSFFLGLETVAFRSIRGSPLLGIISLQLHTFFSHCTFFFLLMHISLSLSLLFAACLCGKEKG